MPELPEVESSRTLIEKYCLNQTIVKVETRELGGGPREGLFDDLVYENDINSTVDKEKSFISAIRNKKLVAVKRRGKYFWFEMEKSDVVIIFHFGMTGSMLFKNLEVPLYKSFKRKGGEWPPKFTKLMLEFSNGLELAFCDARRLGRIKLRTNHLTVPPLSALGLDPVLDPLPSESNLLASFSKLSAPIKAVLLDQEKVFCGLGNWMIDEILYQSGIHPASPAQSLNAACVSRILTNMQHIISTAVSCNNAFQPFPSHWLFHYRWDKGKAAASRMPDGSTISYDTQGGRTSAVVLSKQVKYSVNGRNKTKKVVASEEAVDDPVDEPVKKGRIKKTKTEVVKPVAVKEEQTSSNRRSGRQKRAVVEVKNEVSESIPGVARRAKRIKLMEEKEGLPTDSRRRSKRVLSESVITAPGASDKRRKNRQ